MPKEAQRRAIAQHVRYGTGANGYRTHEKREAVCDDDENHGSYKERSDDVLDDLGKDLVDNVGIA